MAEDVKNVEPVMYCIIRTRVETFPDKHYFGFDRQHIILKQTVIGVIEDEKCFREELAKQHQHACNESKNSCDSDTVTGALLSFGVGFGLSDHTVNATTTDQVHLFQSLLGLQNEGLDHFIQGLVHTGVKIGLAIGQYPTKNLFIEDYERMDLSGRLSR